MTKRKHRSPDDLDGAESLALPGMGAAARFRIPPGRVERALARSVKAATSAGRLDADEHAAAIANAQSLARAVDRTTPAQTQAVAPYQVSVAVAAARELAAQLDALGLMPSTGGDVDPLDALLDGAGTLTLT